MGRKAKWVSLAITAFVLATAVWTRNPAGFALAGITGASTVALWNKKPKD